MPGSRGWAQPATQADLGCGALAVAALCPGIPRTAGQPSKFPPVVTWPQSPTPRNQGLREMLKGKVEPGLGWGLGRVSGIQPLGSAGA